MINGKFSVIAFRIPSTIWGSAETIALIISGSAPTRAVNRVIPASIIDDSASPVRKSTKDAIICITASIIVGSASIILLATLTITVSTALNIRDRLLVSVSVSSNCWIISRAASASSGNILLNPTISSVTILPPARANSGSNLIIVSTMSRIAC